MQKVCKRTWISHCSAAPLYRQALSSHKRQGSPRRVSPCAARGPGPCGGRRAAPSAAAGSWPCARGSSGQPARDRAREGARARLELPHRPGREYTHSKFNSLYRVSVTGAHLRQEHQQFGQLLTGLVRLEGEDLHMGLVVVVLLQELFTQRTAAAEQHPPVAPCPTRSPPQPLPRCAPPRCRTWGRA